MIPKTLTAIVGTLLIAATSIAGCVGQSTLPVYDVKAPVPTPPIPLSGYFLRYDQTFPVNTSCVDRELAKLTLKTGINGGADGTMKGVYVSPRLSNNILWGWKIEGYVLEPIQQDQDLDRDLLSIGEKCRR